MRADTFSVVIPDRPPIGLEGFERRHDEPWDERWKRLTGKAPPVPEKKILTPKAHNSSRQLSSAKASKPSKRKVVMLANRVGKTANGHKRGLRPRAQIPDLIFGFPDGVIE